MRHCYSSRTAFHIFLLSDRFLQMQQLPKFKRLQGPLVSTDLKKTSVPGSFLWIPGVEVFEICRSCQIEQLSFSLTCLSQWDKTWVVLQKYQKDIANIRWNEMITTQVQISFYYLPWLIFWLSSDTFRNGKKLYAVSGALPQNSEPCKKLCTIPRFTCT